jgi:hypothetical protein
MEGEMKSYSRVVTLCAAVGTCLILAACRAGDASGPSTPNIDGNWQLNALVRNADFVPCVISGAISISQSGQNFTGQLSGSTVICYPPQGDSTNNGTVDGPLTGGKISNNVSMSFSNSGCYYRDGLISPATHVFGGVICNLSYQGHSQPFDGTFDLDR